MTINLDAANDYLRAQQYDRRSAEALERIAAALEQLVKILGKDDAT